MKRKERKELPREKKTVAELEEEIEVIKKEIEKQKLLNELEELKKGGNKDFNPITIPIFPREDNPKPLTPHFDPDWYRKGPWLNTPGLFTTVKTTYKIQEPTEERKSHAKNRKD